MYIPQVIRLERTSLLTGNVSTMDLKTTQEKLDIFFKGPKNERPLIQDLFSELTMDEREFIQTGATPDEWAEVERQNSQSHSTGNVIPASMG